jgi:hypothetical protein
VLLVASDQLSQILAGVAVLAGSDAVIDVAPKFVGQSEAHGGLAHFITPPALSTVVNPLLWVGDCLAWDPVTPEKRSLIHPLVF